MLPTSQEDLAVIVSLFGLKRALGPTLDYTGIKVKDLLKPLIDRAIDRLNGIINSDRFQIDVRSINLLCLPSNNAQLLNPYVYLDDWYWLIEDSYKKESYLNTILTERGDISIDRSYFINLLYKSLSLNKHEKKRVIDAWPTLTQWQINELVIVFEDEQIEFEKLCKTETNNVWNLVFEQQCNWSEILIGDNLGIEAFLSYTTQNNGRFPYFEILPNFWHLVGRKYIKLNDYRQAMVAYGRILANKPNSVGALHALAWCQIKCKHYSLAISTLNQAYSVSPESESLQLDLAELYIITADYQSASSVLNNVNISSHSNLLIIYLLIKYILDSLLSPKEIIHVPDRLTELMDDDTITHTWSLDDLRHHISNNAELSQTSKRNLLYIVALMSSKEDVR